jgi:hypothetical protein
LFKFFVLEFIFKINKEAPEPYCTGHGTSKVKFVGKTFDPYTRRIDRLWKLKKQEVLLGYLQVRSGSAKTPQSERLPPQIVMYKTFGDKMKGKPWIDFCCFFFFSFFF